MTLLLLGAGKATPASPAPDVTAPTVLSFSPADNATGVAVGATLIATFDETITLGASGTITLKKTSDNSTIDSWDVASDGGSGAGQVEVLSDDELTLHLTANLQSSTEYYVIWDAGVVKDASNNGVAALSTTTTWSFTTAAYSYANAEAAAWVAAFSSAPSDAVKGYYDTFVGALKAASIWTKIDVLWWLGGPDAQASRINAKNPGSLTLTQVGTVTHTAYRGFAGNGTDGYHTTGYNPSTFGGQWALNSAHLAVYSRTSGQTNSTTELGCRVSGSDNQSLLNLRSLVDTAGIRLNQDVNTGLFPANTDGSGLFVGRRSGSNAIALFRNGSSLGTGTEVSQAVPNLEMFLGALNQNGSATGFSSRELLMASAGASLTDQNITDYNAAVAAFATSIGA